MCNSISIEDSNTIQYCDRCKADDVPIHIWTNNNHHFCEECISDDIRDKMHLGAPDDYSWDSLEDYIVRQVEDCLDSNKYRGTCTHCGTYTEIYFLVGELNKYECRSCIEHDAIAEWEFHKTLSEDDEEYYLGTKEERIKSNLILHNVIPRDPDFTNALFNRTFGIGD